MKTSAVTPRATPPLSAIRLGMADRPDGEARFGTMLVWFMRVLAFLWIAQGLAQWGLMLMGGENGQAALDQMSDLGAAAIMFFAVLDLIAAVGLWLAAAWGGVVWLVAVAAQWFALVILPGFFPYDIAIAAVDVPLVGAYFWLTYRAAREIDQ